MLAAATYGKCAHCGTQGVRLLSIDEHIALQWVPLVRAHLSIADQRKLRHIIA